MDNVDAFDIITTFDEFSAAVSHENYMLTEKLAAAEHKSQTLSRMVDKQLAELEARKAKIEMLESALAFSESKFTESSAALERIAHFVRVERILTGNMPAGETKDPSLTDQNVALTALVHAGAAE